MSSRKVLPRSKNTPARAELSKTSTNRNKSGKKPCKPPTPNHTSTSLTRAASTLSGSQPALKGSLMVNSTFAVGNPSPAIDWDLECELTYSKYLRAVVMQDITRQVVKQHEDALDDQLACQAELLQRGKREVNKVQNEIDDLQFKIEAEEQFSKLEALYSTIVEILVDYKVEKNLDTYIAALKDAASNLYLKNVKPFTTQADYDRFSTLLVQCTETLNKLKTVVGNVQDVETLGGHLEKFIQQQQEFVDKRKVLFDLQDSVVFDIFKQTSDAFATINGYEEESKNL